MKDLTGRVFRHMERARVTGSGGDVQEARGAVTRWKEKSGDPPGSLIHGLGELTEPLYVFTGSLPEVQPGDLLEQGGEVYRVLHGSRVILGDTVVCARAVLEKRETEDDSV